MKKRSGLAEFFYKNIFRPYPCFDALLEHLPILGRILLDPNHCYDSPEVRA